MKKAALEAVTCSELIRKLLLTPPNVETWPDLLTTAVM